MEHPSTTGRTKRDAGITAAIFGLFAMAWFGWAQAAPPDWLVPWLVAGSIASLLTLVAGVVVTVRHRRDGSAMQDTGTNRRYGIIVGAEFAVAGVGAVVLGAAGVPQCIPVWIGAVVGHGGRGWRGTDPAPRRRDGNAPPRLTFCTVERRSAAFTGCRSRAATAARVTPR